MQEMEVMQVIWSLVLEDALEEGMEKQVLPLISRLISKLYASTFLIGLWEN